jgi:drug/metabolite transporter (DMT)-like permease
MPPELLALGAAVCFASGKIAVKFATQTGGVMVGFLVTLATGVVALGLLAAFTVETWTIPFGPFVLFALGGIAGPGVGRILAIRAVRDAGTSVAVPLQSSANPLISTVAGVLLFGETVGLGRVLALGLIIAGIWACARGGSANRHLSDLPASRRTLWLALLLPLAAGAAYATGDVLTKFALAEYGEPVAGAFVGSLTAFVIWLGIFLVTPQFRGPVRISASLGFFVVSGLFSAAAMTLVLSALRGGDLSVVAPIVASQPVIVIVLGALLLRSLEKLRPGTVIGAVLVFAGVAYLSLN